MFDVIEPIDKPQKKDKSIAVSASRPDRESKTDFSKLVISCSTIVTSCEKGITTSYCECQRTVHITEATLNIDKIVALITQPKHTKHHINNSP